MRERVGVEQASRATRRPTSATAAAGVKAQALHKYQPASKLPSSANAHCRACRAHASSWSAVAHLRAGCHWRPESFSPPAGRRSGSLYQSGSRTAPDGAGPGGRTASRLQSWAHTESGHSILQGRAGRGSERTAVGMGGGSTRALGRIGERQCAGAANDSRQPARCHQHSATHS